MSLFTPECSLRAAQATLADFLKEAGIEEPRRLARRIMCHATGWEDATFFARDEEVLSVEAALLAESIARRAAKHEPLSRILGRREFFGLTFQLGSQTLDPRPETEHLVEAVLKRFAPQKEAPLRLLDLGTGSGAILLSLLHSLPNATGLGIDIAEGAVEIARANAARLNLQSRAVFEQGDLFPEEGQLFDAILSNPPYIPRADIADLMPEVRDYDPHTALDGGEDGLDFYRRIATRGRACLAQGGVLALEIGQGQSEAVLQILESNGWINCSVLPDYAGIARVILVE